MTQPQWQHLETLIGAMSPEDKERLVTLLTPNNPPRGSAHDEADSDLARDPTNPSLGLFSDEPELIDRIMEHVYDARANHPLRASD